MELWVWKITFSDLSCEDENYDKSYYMNYGLKVVKDVSGQEWSYSLLLEKDFLYWKSSCKKIWWTVLKLIE